MKTRAFLTKTITAYGKDGKPMIAKAGQELAPAFNKNGNWMIGLWVATSDAGIQFALWESPAFVRTEGFEPCLTPN